MLDGTAPANEGIKMNADPVCMKENKGPQQQETYTVGSGGALGNVFVYVKDGLGNYVFDTPTEPLNLDQKGCRYNPHVIGIRVNQPLQIVNSDPTLHNIHALPKANKEFNNGQPIQGMKMTHTFTAKEVMLPFKCDVHGWMNAYVGRARSPVLRRDRHRRQVRAQDAPARHLHDRGLAREARRRHREGDARRERDEGRHVPLQGAGDGNRLTN